MSDLTPTERADVDHLIRTLRGLAARPEVTDPMVTRWVANEAADLLRVIFPFNYTTPPPPHEGMTSLFTESSHHGEG